MRTYVSLHVKQDDEINVEVVTYEHENRHVLSFLDLNIFLPDDQFQELKYSLINELNKVTKL